MVDVRVQQLQSYLKEYQIDLDDEEISLCLKHLDLVVEKNKQLNLTRILDMDDALVLHLIDSLLLLPYIQKAPEGKLLDMGSGGGFPGIELAIGSGRSTTLIDSVGKKVDALNEFSKNLDLTAVYAEHKRLEELTQQEKFSYACVTARALASMPVLIEYARPYLMNDGLLVLTKGKPQEEEIESGKKAASICGMELVEAAQYELPRELGHRELYIYRVVRKSKVKLPRQIGLAKKKPLA